MDDFKEGCGCFIASWVIAGIVWICMQVSGGSHSTTTDTTPAVQPYTLPQNNYAPPTNYTPTYEVPTSSRVETPDDAYDNGYDEGYNQGLEDGKNGHSHGYGYDDSSDYYNYYETRHQEGYEEGYDEGYNRGKSRYEEEQENSEEDD